jgi:L-ascorbate metabolism protein UlaG (beta-lactamase superfamily)
MEQKEDPEENAMYRLELDGVSVLHMGDAGNPPTEEQLARLRGRVDVLLALAGGPPTIELNDLDWVIVDIGPRVVIPMHYQIPKLKVDEEILPVQGFVSRYPQEKVVNVGTSDVEFTPDTLPKGLSVYPLEPAN